MSEIINAVKCGICGEKVKAHDPDDHECKPKKYCEKWENNFHKITCSRVRQFILEEPDCPWCGKELPCG